jgi:hypothetical protein
LKYGIEHDEIICGQINLPFQGANNIFLITKGDARLNNIVGHAFGLS